MLEIIKKTNIDFVGKSLWGFCFSGILVCLGLIALIMILLGKAKLSVDFTSGTLIQMSLEKQLDINQIRTKLQSIGHDAEIQSFAQEKKTYLIRTKFSPDLVPKLKKLFQNENIVIQKVDMVGPKIGNELKLKALRAIALALVGLLIYIAFRFEFRYGVAAVIATLHDVLAVLGLMFILQREIDLLVVTALLTLAGYSLTDTVVVFDRIRHNIKLFKKKVALPDIINRSINEVLSRTIITSLTTIIVLVVLLIKGTSVTYNFALAMLLGVIIGTYSSIFIASPIIVIWQKLQAK